MPDLFGAWTRRWLFDVAPGSPDEGRTRIVSALVHNGGRVVSVEAEVTEIAFGSATWFRSLGILLPVARVPLLVRVVPERSAAGPVIGVEVLSDPGFYAFFIRSVFDWSYSRAYDRLWTIIQEETGFPLVASLHVPDALRVRRELPPGAIL